MDLHKVVELVYISSNEKANFRMTVLKWILLVNVIAYQCYS